MIFIFLMIAFVAAAEEFTHPIQKVIGSAYTGNKTAARRHSFLG